MLLVSGWIFHLRLLWWHTGGRRVVWYHNPAYHKNVVFSLDCYANSGIHLWKSSDPDLAQSGAIAKIIQRLSEETVHTCLTWEDMSFTDHISTVTLPVVKAAQVLDCKVEISCGSLKYHSRGILVSGESYSDDVMWTTLPYPSEVSMKRLLLQHQTGKNKEETYFQC